MEPTRLCNKGCFDLLKVEDRWVSKEEAFHKHVKRKRCHEHKSMNLYAIISLSTDITGVTKSRCLFIGSGSKDSISDMKSLLSSENAGEDIYVALIDPKQAHKARHSRFRNDSILDIWGFEERGRISILAVIDTSLEDPITMERKYTSLIKHKLDQFEIFELSDSTSSMESELVTYGITPVRCRVDMKSIRSVSACIW